MLADSDEGLALRLSLVLGILGYSFVTISSRNVLGSMKRLRLGLKEL